MEALKVLNKTVRELGWRGTPFHCLLGRRCLPNTQPRVGGTAWLLISRSHTNLEGSCSATSEHDTAAPRQVEDMAE
eukprot:12923595-Prorocentrum_lima.AAC.1